MSTISWSLSLTTSRERAEVTLYTSRKQCPDFMDNFRIAGNFCQTLVSILKTNCRINNNAPHHPHWCRENLLSAWNFLLKTSSRWDRLSLVGAYPRQVSQIKEERNLLTYKCPTLKLLSRNCVKIAVFPTSVWPRITTLAVTRAEPDIWSLGFICKW